MRDGAGYSGRYPQLSISRTTQSNTLTTLTQAKALTSNLQYPDGHLTQPEEAQLVLHQRSSETDPAVRVWKQKAAIVMTLPWRPPWAASWGRKRPWLL